MISFRGDQEWPSRSCDLTPSDFFMWGKVKLQLYIKKLHMIQELKAETIRIIIIINNKFFKLFL